MATTAFPVAGANNSKYYMNPQPGPSPTEQQQYGGPKPAFTAIDTALPNTNNNTTTPPSANVSPTNHHHMSAAVRHIRQPRQPLYVPAALRPSEYCARATDIPSRPRALDTPPSSKDNSLDSSNNKTTTSTNTTSPPPTTTTTNSSSSTTSLHRRAASAHPGSTTSPGSTHQHPFARPSSTGPATAGFQHANQNITLNTSESFLYNNNPSNSSSTSQDTSRQSWTPTSWSSAADPITGPPTSAHWKPDESSPSCSVCAAKFSWFFRRHHCRRCGDVVCSAHSGKMVPLDQNARFHPRGLRVKVCDPCAGEWGVVRRVSIGSGAGELTPTTSGASAAREGGEFGGVGGSEVDARPILGSGNRGLTREEEERERELRIGSLARSEGGMIWSTF